MCGGVSQDAQRDHGIAHRDADLGYMAAAGQVEQILLDQRLACPERVDFPLNKDTAADAEFIANARADVPRLVDEIRRLHALLDQHRIVANGKR